MSDSDEILDNEPPRRKPGRPRKDPRGTQAELRAAARRGTGKQVREREGLAFVQSYAAELVQAQKGGDLHDVLVQLAEHANTVCMSADLSLEPVQIREALAKAIGEEITKQFISSAALIDWQAQKLAAFMEQQRNLAAATQAPITPPTPQIPVQQQAPVVTLNGHAEVDIDALMAQGLPSSDDD